MKSMSDVRRSEQGLVSILVTMIMIIVITLIVVGFTQVTNRNNREALDKQLSTQAFYAAESGVNQAINNINLKYSTGALKAQTNCNETSSPQYGQVPVLSAEYNVAVTCLLVDPVGENVATSADVGTSTTVPIESTDDKGTQKNLTNMIITWGSPETAPASVGTNCATAFAGGFPASLPANCTYGLLRVDLMQYQSPQQIKDPQTSADQTETYYFVPSSSASSVTPDPFASGKQKAYIVNAACDTSRCRAVLTLDASGATKKYFARVSSLYKSAPNVIFDGTNNGTAGDAYFVGIFKIDATGKAQDVLRRIQVRYNPYATGGSPFAGLQTTSGNPTNPGAGVCKLLTVVASNKVISDGTCN